MPRIPGCADAVSTLMLDESKSAQANFERDIPKAYWLTRERLESKTNSITSWMGQGEAAPEQVDEAAMLSRAVRAKL